MSNTIETLEIEIIGSSQSAEKALDALKESLGRIKTAVKGGIGLTAVTNQLSKMNTALGSVDSSKISNLKALADGLQKLSSVGKFKLSSSVANQIASLGTATKALNGIDFSKLTELSNAISPLSTIGKANLGSTINQLGKLPSVIQPISLMEMSVVKSKMEDLVDAVKPLAEMGKANLSSTLNQIKKLPEAFATLNSIDMDAFKVKIDELTDSLSPLATEMEKVANGFSAFPEKIQKLLNETNKIPKANGKAGTSYVNFAAKLKITYSSLKRVSSVVASWINQSNEYIENLNLFTVALGEYASEAKEYAETVGELMGIDSGEWMRNQGVFMTLATGFGVVNDRAYTMSKNLTQLGYDLSSFFNITYEDAMQKLQSGISGELEPLRRLGYDLSQAKLEAVALSLGIDKTVSSMTQAEKAELRYYAIMTQVTTSHGDMARTLEAPANQLRVLQAQVTQAARALGNIFIPVLNTVLPYVIAFTRVIRDLATEIANFFGFSLPEVDYSGIENLGGSVSDVTDSLDEATESAQKLKKSILGIDELNVLTDNSSASADIDISGGGTGFDFELPEYTFLDDISANVDEIYDKLKKILEPVGTILEYLYEYKEIVLAGLGVAALGSLWKKVNSVWKKFKKLKIVDAFLTGFTSIRSEGGSILESINGGITNVRNNLSGIQKAGIVAVAGFAEFAVIGTSVKELVKGSENASARIVEIGVAAAGAATAMYVALGPYGVALAAVIGLAGAVAGVRTAYQEMQQELVDSVFFDGVGVSLDAFKGKLEDVTDQFNIQNGAIVEWKEQLDSSNEKIDDIDLKIQTLSGTLGSMGVVTAEEIEEIKGQFQLLYDAVAEKMSLSEEVISTALVGALQRATPEISAQIDILIGEYQRYVRETQGRAAELKGLIDNGYDQLIGKQKDDPAYQEIMANIQAWYKELGFLAGGMSEAGWQWQQTVQEFNNGDKIDLGDDIEDAKSKIGEIVTVGETALADLATARDTALREIDNSIRYASAYGTLEEVELLGDIRQTIADDYAAQEQSIKEELNSVFGAIQTSMFNNIEDVQNAAAERWADMTSFERSWTGSQTEEQYVAAALSDWQDYINTISTEIQGYMNTLETDGSTWASDAMQGIMRAFVNFDEAGVVAGFSGNLGEIVEQVLSDTGKTGKKVAFDTSEEMVNGLTNGVCEKTSEIRKAWGDSVEEMDEAIRKAAEINSPSKLFARDSGFMMDGLIKGIKDKLTSLKDTMTSVVKSAFDVKSASSLGYDYGESFAKGIVKAIKNISFPTIKGVVNTSGSSPSISFKTYATGGFPDSGQMFVAREAGPELVGTIGSRTAVVNNDQIVESVSQGVYEANGEQNALLREQNNLLRKLLDKDTNVTAVLSTSDIISGFERKNRRDGKTVVPVEV